MQINTAGIMFAVSPLLIVLFAFEMCAIDEVAGHGTLEPWLGNDAANKARFYAMTKLPASLVVPVIGGMAGLAAVAVLDAASVMLIIKLCTKKKKS